MALERGRGWGGHYHLPVKCQPFLYFYTLVALGLHYGPQALQRSAQASQVAARASLAVPGL